MSWLRGSLGHGSDSNHPAQQQRAGLSCCLLTASLLVMAAAASGDTDLEGGISYTAVGKASYYSTRLQGKRTASGEQYDETALTAAHTDLPFDAQVCITNLYNGRTTAVRINDRGPYSGNRIIDVSLAAAKELGMLGVGTARVRVETCNDLDS